MDDFTHTGPRRRDRPENERRKYVQIIRPRLSLHHSHARNCLPPAHGCESITPPDRWSFKLLRRGECSCFAADYSAACACLMFRPFADAMYVLHTNNNAEHSPEGVAPTGVVCFRP